MVRIRSSVQSRSGAPEICMDFTLIIQHLRTRLSGPQLLATDHEKRPYFRDYSPSTLIECPHFIVVIPYSESDVEFILKTSTFYEIPLVVRGTGTGTTGGALPVTACIVMSFEKMNRILEIDIHNQVAVVEPGVITGDLHRAVETVGLFYPPDPASLDICTIGGNVAENAGGPRCLKYGVTKDYVLGLSGFYSDGTPFSFGGKLLKNVAGYDIIGLLVGSEGTLAIITQITLKLIPLPESGPMIHCAFECYDDAFLALHESIRCGARPSSVEFIDTTCLNAVQACHGISIDDADRTAHLLIELEGKDTRPIEAILQKKAALMRFISEPTEKEFFWKIRRLVSTSLKQQFPQKASHDIVVPVAQIATYMAFLVELSKETGIQVIGYGHLGDGNIHVNLLFNEACDEATKHALTFRVLDYAVGLKGSITGEHGIGLSKKPFLSLMFSQDDIALFKRLKLAFDPKGLLNPFKIID